MFRVSHARMNTISRYVVVLALVIFLYCTGLPAQVTSGTIFGTVQDPSGAFIKDASVTVINPANGVTRTVRSADNGDFVVPNLLPGTYNITIEAPGFKKLGSSGVVLSAADRLNAGNFVLAVGTSAESVTVTADAGQIQLQANSGERSDLITGKQLNDVALNGRMVLDYMKLIPGVVSTYDGSASGTGGINTFNINGTRANQHEYTIDGSSNVDTGDNGNTHVTINTDAIAEVKVLTSNYQAEFGKAGGGQVAVTTRSGSNQFHGDARFFHRNEGLNANGWFNNHNNPITPIALYRYNYAGYQFGGPVIIPGTQFNKSRDRLFFFWGQEYYRQLIPTGGIDTFRTPTALERQGDFSQTVDGDGNPLIVYNPATGLPFPGNKIDPATLTPAQQAIFTNISKVMSLYALPNVTGNNSYNYATQLSYSNPRREDILRLDYQINSKNRFYGRWINNSQHTTGPMETWNLLCMGQLQLPGGCTNDSPSWNVSANLVTTLSPTLLNEVSVGPSVQRSTWSGTNGNLSVGKNNINLPLLFPVSPSTSIPDISFQGNNNISYPWSYFGANPWFQANTTINFNDNVTWVKNNHALKFGVFYQRSRKDQIAWGNSNGQFTFDNCATSADPSTCPNSSGIAYASALLGEFRSFSQSSSRPIGFFRYNQLEFYAQDTWKLTPRLTLDYGMRFAWIPPQYDAKNQLALFVPSLYDPATAVQINRDGSVLPNSGNPLDGIGFSNRGTLPKGGWKSRGIMPEPRLGFAYDMTSDHKTVLRGGFGTSHDRSQGNLVFNTVFGNPANVVTPTVSNGNLLDIGSLPQSSPGVLGAIYGADQTGKVPVVYSYSLGVQRDLGFSTTLDVAYVGTLSRHQVTARDINAVPFGTAFTAAAQNPANFSGRVVPAVEPFLPPEYAAAGLNFSGGKASDTNFLVPYKGYGQIQYYQFDGTANYNSLQIALQRRFSRGLTFGAAYTWSHTLTTANADQDMQYTQFTRELDYRNASWDRTHVVAINYVYDLPGLTKHFGGPKWLSYITDNYQLSGVTQFMTGAPLEDNPVNGNLALWVPGNQLTGSDMWGALPPAWVGLDNNGNLMLPTIGKPFTGSRADIRGGGMQNWDMSIFKNIPLGSEQRYFQLRLEAFNVFNHPNFQDKGISATLTLPSCDASGCIPMSITKGSNFGQYTNQYSGVGGPRVIQLGAKFYF
jgi:carboxypeptidase family protein/TonB-dependent receptor-like protein